ncbi:MAG: type II toxin-antitoxin system RelE/ParE family toxin [Candidatus Brocadiaceae bacterium]|uniref:type II toxin-antitoxin system RelE family toxin n=1 Tax=Candidatus Wunengus sp. YC61 TaxID=3367698 RepID=UPI002717EDEF|nr:type II toxin-antitoxin system RelE/ParE family toxin [Candidatus Brocadiaceae bacterium]
MVMFRIEFTPEAIEDMRLFRKTDRKRIINEIEKQLKHQPIEETRNRKRLRPNELAEWELRIDKFRVFYDIDETVEFVKIETVGFKRGSILYIRGKEYKL